MIYAITCTYIYVFPYSYLQKRGGFSHIAQGLTPRFVTKKHFPMGLRAGATLMIQRLPLAAGRGPLADLSRAGGAGGRDLWLLGDATGAAGTICVSPASHRDES